MVRRRAGDSVMDNIFMDSFGTKAVLCWWGWMHLEWPELFPHQSLFILLDF